MNADSRVEIVWPLTCRGFFSEYNVMLWMLLYSRMTSRGFRLQVTDESIISLEFAQRLFNVEIATGRVATEPRTARAGLRRVLGRLFGADFSPEFLFDKLWRRRYERKVNRQLDSLEALRRLHEEVWRGCDEAGEEIGSALQQLGLSRDDRYVAMHVRRGDKVVMEARYVAADVFVSRIPAEFAQLPVLVATDDYRAVQEVEQSLAAAGRANRVLTTATPGATGHDEASFRARSLSDRNDLVRRVVTDFCLLCRSAHFIGSFSSNLSRTVHVARGGRASCSVDTDFRFIQ